MSDQPPSAGDQSIDYIPIRLGTLRDNSKATFDIYIPLSDRYVHYIKLSDVIDLVRLDKLKTKGIKKLFIPREHEDRYLKYLDEGLNQLNQPSLPPEKKAEVAHAGLIAISEATKEAVETEAGYNQAQVQVGKVMEFLLSDKSAVTNVVSSVEMSEDIHQHCATVATLSIAMANALDVKEVSHLLELGMAAMLHDVGLMNLGFDPNTPKDKMTSEQVVQYQLHPVLAKELLGQKRYVSPNVLQMILDHEEIGEGVGYPSRKNVKKLNLLSQILNLCNNYDRYCQERQYALSKGADMYVLEQASLSDVRLHRTLIAIIKGK
jgi:HD-GYP domain-containing protein (c-di-GMP phosphodiesterase class II)